MRLFDNFSALVRFKLQGSTMTHKACDFKMVRNVPGTKALHVAESFQARIDP